MTGVILFHHALGLTPGVAAFADDLRGAGHEVHTPDLYDGRTFETLETGLAHAEGFSLGVLPAQKLAQTRPGARGALLFYSCVPLGEFAPEWPDGVPGRSSSTSSTATSSSTAATSTTSPTARCRPTTPGPPRCS